MTASTPMPQYQCHKKVWALKIAEITPKPNPDLTGRSAASSYGAVITPFDADYAPFDVTAEYMCKHQPKAGGYYVVYENGYLSYSPGKVFDEGYAPVRRSILEELHDAHGDRWNAEADQSESRRAGHMEKLIGGSVAPVQTIAGLFGSVAVEATYSPIKDLVTGEELEPITVAPRVTMQDIERQIVSSTFSNFKDSTVTVCLIRLLNGFDVIGENACASPENFDPAIGRTLAYENAKQKIWALEGYRLKTKLFEAACGARTKGDAS